MPAWWALGVQFSINVRGSRSSGVPVGAVGVVAGVPVAVPGVCVPAGGVGDGVSSLHAAIASAKKTSADSAATLRTAAHQCDNSAGAWVMIVPLRCRARTATA